MNDDRFSFLTLAESRYSVRKFDSRPVEREKTELILKAGRLSPTACNLQPQRVLVIDSGEALEKLRRCTMSHFGCMLAMLVCYDKSECWVRDYDGKQSGEADASIVATHMMLEACSLGVGCTWVMHFIPEAVKEEFAIPDEYEPVCLLVMGYPATDAKPNPRHYSKKAEEETVFFNGFERDASI